MGSIVLLDELTINQIAAGEVIERPASVVKEMVENSIDAGAKHITIEIKNGGISFIRITDDGKGIQKDDVEMAFERHATSKIRSADDLQEVKSMGFRGEALASIAAISNVELVSKQESDEVGTRIVLEGGNKLSLDEIGCSKGTTITIRNLFFNTPVRYKFLKKDFTESGYIEDVVTRIALIHPDVSIKFINTGKNVLSTNGSGNIKDAIYSIFGKEVANNLIDIDYEYETIRIKGVVGKPSICRSNRSNQIFYVNTRYVKDKTLNSAVEQAFKGMLPFGKFPFLVLNVEMNPSKVDVNVHPAKLEVRFSEENTVFKAMYHAIKDALLNQEITKEEKGIDENQINLKTFEQEPQVEKIETNIKEETPKVKETAKIDFSGEEILSKLKLLQDELKKETEENPNIKLTDKYKEMKEKYTSILSKEFSLPQKEQKDSENIQNEADKATNEKIEEMTKELENNYIEKDENIPTENTQEDVASQYNENDKETKEVEDTNENQLVEDSTIEIQANSEIQENWKEQEKIETEEKNEVEEKIDVEKKGEAEEKINGEEKSETEVNIETEEKQEVPEQQDTEKEISFRKMYKQLFGKEPYGGKEVEEKSEENKNFYTVNDNDFSQDNLSMFENDEQFSRPDYKLIGTAFDSYIILEIKNELFVMSQKMANERIMYEKIRYNFYNEGSKSSQMLLLPDVISLDTKQMNIAKDNMKLFQKAGFTLEEFGENTIKLSGVPEICLDLNTEELFKEILEEINQAPRIDEAQKEAKFIDAISSRVAEKIPIYNSKEEIESLIEELLSLQNPFINSQGNPIVIKMSRYEIERKFARK